MSERKLEIFDEVEVTGAKGKYKGWVVGFANGKVLVQDETNETEVFNLSDLKPLKGEDK